MGHEAAQHLPISVELSAHGGLVGEEVWLENVLCLGTQALRPSGCHCEDALLGFRVLEKTHLGRDSCGITVDHGVAHHLEAEILGVLRLAHVAVLVGDDRELLVGHGLRDGVLLAALQQASGGRRGRHHRVADLGRHRLQCRDGEVPDAAVTAVVGGQTHDARRGDAGHREDLAQHVLHAVTVGVHDLLERFLKQRNVRRHAHEVSNLVRQIDVELFVGLDELGATRPRRAKGVRTARSVPVRREEAGALGVGAAQRTRGLDKPLHLGGSDVVLRDLFVKLPSPEQAVQLLDGPVVLLLAVAVEPEEQICLRAIPPIRAFAVAGVEGVVVVY
mmetsp:Transcript_49253/g.159003  ORF Transcript_49253/g.159003 Transcript_49253/m.159003 type:complete len:332 (-) Transcript_49253:1032-2027(-)